MKRHLLILAAALLLSLTASATEATITPSASAPAIEAPAPPETPATASAATPFQVSGPQGGLSMKVSLPEGFDSAKDSCRMVILMHGIFSSKDYPPMPQIAKALAREGIVSIRFDFDGHGRSEGKMVDMTIANELADARAI